MSAKNIIFFFLCVLGFMGRSGCSFCFKCPCQYFLLLSVNYSSMESLVTVPWLNNCNTLLFHSIPRAGRSGRGRRVGELIATAIQCFHWIVLKLLQLLAAHRIREWLGLGGTSGDHLV